MRAQHRPQEKEQGHLPCLQLILRQRREGEADREVGEREDMTT
jgi:hypothetical protein